MARQDHPNMIAALLREREGYARRGLTERVAQVDEQLEHYGYEDPERQAPKGRTAPAPDTAAAKAPAKTAAASKPKAAPASKPATAAQSRAAAAAEGDSDKADSDEAATGEK